MVPSGAAKANSVEQFAPSTRAWFTKTFPAPAAVQAAAWAAIGAGENALVIAPTGSGKTLAAFTQAIDQLFRKRELANASAEGCRVVLPGYLQLK